jgi:hypothetical protein
MRNWRIALVVTLILITGLAVWNGGRAIARRRRAVGYQTTLRTYSQALHVGTTRAQVEENLRSRNVHFTWMSTAFGGRTKTQYADLVKIGEESAPWYCSEEYVYVALEFSSTIPFEQDESDLLERVEIFQPDSGCL